jgi:hypothetical protein
MEHSLENVQQAIDYISSCKGSPEAQNALDFLQEWSEDPSSIVLGSEILSTSADETEQKICRIHPHQPNHYGFCSTAFRAVVFLYGVLAKNSLIDIHPSTWYNICINFHIAGDEREEYAGWIPKRAGGGGSPV